MRTNTFKIGCHVLLFASLISHQGFAQSPGQQKGAYVEITTTKKSYDVGEPIQFRVLFINRGNVPFWVAKSFSELGGGMAGFIINVKQITGKPPKFACGVAGDRSPGTGSRSSEQILKEDFLYLPPGGMIGYEDHYRGCDVLNPGQYQISADYVAGDLNQERVEHLNGDGASVLKHGTYRSTALAFTVR
jgi:hypothetical protein